VAEWKGKTRGNLLGFKIFVWLLQNFGIRGAYLLLYLVVPYFVPFAPKATKGLYLLYRKRLGYGRLKTISYIFKNYFVLGQSLIDRVAIKSGFRDKYTSVHEYTENINEMVAAGKGGFLLSGHLGNWDLAGHLMKTHQGKVNIVMYDEEHQKIKQFLSETSGTGSTLNIIPIKDDLSHIVEMRKALRNGEIITMHADRFREGNRTLKLEFLGKDALFPQGPFLLASKFKAPVSFVFCVLERDLHYHFFASKAQVFETEESLSRAYINSLEQKVKDYPLNWNNYYNFWQMPENTGKLR
jgi:predicted LPLAT superfamily acyltransferase